MSNKAKKKKQNKPKPTTRKSGVEIITTRLTLRTAFLGRSVARIAGQTLLASYALYVYFWKGNGNTPFESTGVDVVILSVVFLSFFLVLFTASLDLAAKTFRVQESVEQYKLRHATILNTYIISVTTLIYALGLKQGYLDWLATFLKANVFPALSNGANYLISNFIGWAISGIVGNFFYDLLKRLFVDKKEK